MVNMNKVSDLNERLLAEISRVVIGKEEIKEALIVALIAGGHVLVEGLPGTAKTQLAKTFAGVIGGKFKRIQFTPDMMPADVTGFYAYSPDGSSRFVDGPIFADVVLADELNRTTPRTQAALLEAMQEKQVTVEKNTYPLPQHFMVIATQVESGAEGTYSITDVQMDRFILRALSKYPSKEEEKQVISNIDSIDEPDVNVIITLDEIKELQMLAKRVEVSPDITEYIVSFIELLRQDNDILSGPSSRCSIALYKCSRVLALLDGRDFVIPDDVKRLIFPATEHRIKIKPEAEMDDVTPRTVLERILEQVAVPKLEI